MKEVLKKLVEKLTSSKLSDEEKAELRKEIEEIEKSIVASSAAAPKPKETPALSPEVQEMITALQGQVKALSDALAEETRLRKQQADAVAAQMKKDREAKIEAALKKAKDEGKITPAQESHYKKLLESDFDTTVEIINALPVNPAVKKGDEKKADEKSQKIPPGATLATGGSQAIREQIAKLTTISDN